MVKHFKRNNKIEKNKTNSEKEEENEEVQTQNVPIKCFIRGCRTYFSNINNLKCHLLTHLEEKKQFVCNFQKCYSHFKNIISLYKHFIEKHKENLLKNENKFLFDLRLFENIKCVKRYDKKNLLEIKEFIRNINTNKNAQNELNETREENSNINYTSNETNFGSRDLSNINQHNSSFINQNQNLFRNVNFNFYDYYRSQNNYFNNYYSYKPNFLNDINSKRIAYNNNDHIYQPINNSSIMGKINSKRENNQYCINISNINYINPEQSNVNFGCNNLYSFKDNMKLLNYYPINNNLFSKLSDDNFSQEINRNLFLNNEAYQSNNIPKLNNNIFENDRQNGI